MVTAKQNQKFPFHFFFRFAVEGWGEETREKCKEIFWFLHTRVRERVRGALVRITTQSGRTIQSRATTRSARAHHWSLRSKKVRAKATISPQIETSESERGKKPRADGAGGGKRCRRFATNWGGTGISKRADLSRTSGFVPIFCTNDLISWKSFDVDKKLACFKSKIQFRRGSTQLFLPRSKSFIFSLKARIARMRVSFRVRYISFAISPSR